MNNRIYKPKMAKPSRSNSIRSKKPSILSSTPIRILLLCSLILSGLGYLILSNHVATKGFVMKDLQTKIETLTQTNERLEVQVMDLKSLGNVKDASAELDLVRVSKMEYLSDVEPTFALKSD